MAYKILRRDPYSYNPTWKFCFKCNTEVQARNFIRRKYEEYSEDEYRIIYPGPHGYPSPKKFNNPNNPKYFGMEQYYVELYKLNRIY